MLHDKRRRAQLEGSFLERGLIGSGENNDLDVWSDRHHLPADLEPVDVGQSHVDHNHIWLQACSGVEQLTTGTKRADDCVRRFEQPLQRRKKARVVVRQEDSGRRVWMQCTIAVRSRIRSSNVWARRRVVVSLEHARTAKKRRQMIDGPARGPRSRCRLPGSTTRAAARERAARVLAY